MESCDADKFREFNTNYRDCTFYYTGIGIRGTDNFADSCSLIRQPSSTYCIEEKNASYSDKDYGMSWGDDSRCFNSNLLSKNVYRTNKTDHRYLNYINYNKIAL